MFEHVTFCAAILGWSIEVLAKERMAGRDLFCLIDIHTFTQG
jgi:hypothetical protein